MNSICSLRAHAAQILLQQRISLRRCAAAKSVIDANRSEINLLKVVQDNLVVGIGCEFTQSFRTVTFVSPTGLADDLGQFTSMGSISGNVQLPSRISSRGW